MVHLFFVCVGVWECAMCCCVVTVSIHSAPDDHFIPMNECRGIQIRQFPLNEVLFSLKQYYRTVFRMSLEEWVLAYIFWESQCASSTKKSFSLVVGGVGRGGFLIFIHWIFFILAYFFACCVWGGSNNFDHVPFDFLWWLLLLLLFESLYLLVLEFD